MGSASTIPLMGQQPTFTTPGQYAQQGLGLQNLALGNALQAQRIKEASVQAQQQAAALAANQQIQQSFVTNGGDYDKTRQDIIGKVPLQFVQKFDQDHLENVQATQRMHTTDLALQASQNGQIVSMIEGLSALPDAQKPDFYQKQVLPQLQKMGVSTDGLPTTLPADGSANDLINSYGAAHNYKGQLFTDAQRQQRAVQEKAAAARSDAQAASTQAAQVAADRQRDLEQAAQSHRAIEAIPDADQQQAAHAAWLAALPKSIAPMYKGLETYSPTVADAIQKLPLNAQQLQTGATADQRVKDAEARAEAATNAPPKTAAELALVAGDSRKPQAERNAANAALKILKDQRPVTTVNIGAPGLANTDVNLTGQEFLNSLPKATAAQVRAIAEGRATIPSGSARTQAAQQMRNAVFQYDPTYSDQRAQVRKAFTTGTDGRNIGALNTAPVHLDQLADAAAALSNGSFRPGNQIWNSIRSTFGASAPTNFDGLKSAVSSEMATALKGNATDQEIKAINNTIQSSSSPKQLAGIIDTNLDILKAKLNTYKERYDQQLPGDTVYSPVLPSAKAVFDKHAASTVIPPAVTQLLSGKNVAPGIHKLSDGSTYIKAADGTITKQ